MTWVVEVTLKDIERLKQEVLLNQLPKWKDSWFGNSTLKVMADTFYFIHAAEGFWVSQHNNLNNNGNTLVYCGYW